MGGSFPQRKLTDGRARKNIKIERIGGFDAGLNFIKSGGGDHGGIIAGKTRFGEEELRRVRLGKTKISHLTK